MQEPHIASSSSGNSFAPGMVLRGTYRILHQLGAGGMGRVYAASHTRLPGLFAVKALHHEFAQNEMAVVRFRTEAEIMAGLRHPHVVQVFDFDVAEDGTPYLVMEFIEGQSLGERLGTGEALSPMKVGHLIAQIASALDAAHRRGIVHRDLKPDNVMLLGELGQENFVKVVDFGISKAHGGQRITSERTILGTPQYMAPEQAQGRHDEVEPRTDQFSLAAMAYTLLAGSEPFRGEDPVTVLYQVVHEDAPPLARHVSWSRGAVDLVLAKAMSKDVADRYSGIIEFATALEHALRLDLSDTGPFLTTTFTPPPPPVSFVRRSHDARRSGVVTIQAANPNRASSEASQTLLIPRTRGRSNAVIAALGVAAAALLAATEFYRVPLQAVRSVLLAVPAPAHAAVASDSSPTSTP